MLQRAVQKMGSAAGGFLRTSGSVENVLCNFKTASFLAQMVRPTHDSIHTYHDPASRRIQRKSVSHYNEVGAGGVLRRRQYCPGQPARRALLPISLYILSAGT